MIIHDDSTERALGNDPEAAHPLLLPLSRAEAAHLIRLSLAATAAWTLAATYDGAGALSIQPTSGVPSGGISAGLTNLARILAAERRDRWPQLVDAHFDRLSSALLHGPPPIPENPERDLYQRLIPANAVRPQLTTSAPEFVPGLLSVPATDINGTITMYFDPSDLGLTWHAAEQAGLRNLRSLTDTVEYADYEGTRVALLTGTPFTASRALVLDTVLRESLQVENPTHGVLAAMPVRDLLLLHVITDLRAIPALAMMLTLATRSHVTEPGPLTPQVFLATSAGWHPATTHPTIPRLSSHFLALTRTLTDPA